MTSRRIVDLGNAAGIAYLDDLFAKLEARRAEGAAVPRIEEIRADLRAAGERGAVPARVDKGKQSGDHYLWLYVDARYALNLDPAANGRGYVIRDVRPLRLREVVRIARDRFALRAGAWHVYDHPGELPDGLSARWDTVKTAWHTRPGPADDSGRPDDWPSELPARHASFLDTLMQLVEQARQIELAGTTPDRVFRYRGIEPLAARRHNARSLHMFRLMGESEGAELTVGARVFVEGHPDKRGTVRDISESLARIHFDRPLHFDDIPRMGSFIAAPDLTTFAKQDEAIGILRHGRSGNPHLLDAIVDLSFRPFRPAGKVGPPTESLDVSQRAAFKMALAVPDLGLIQGPPGTGKTRTIRQVIIQRCLTEGERVLVSAYTNQAVDNVLKGLPETLTVIRVGDGVTDACAHLTLDSQALRLQRRISDRVDPLLERYAVADPETGEPAQRLRQFAAERGRLADASQRVRNLLGRLAELDAAVTARTRANLDRLADEAVTREAAARKAGQAVADVSARQADAARIAAMPLIGGLARARRERLAAALSRAEAETEAARRAAERARRERDAATAALDRYRAAHPALADARASLEQSRKEYQEQAKKAAAVARLVRDCLPDTEGLMAPQPVESVLDNFETAARDAAALAGRRLRLLRDWRSQLGRKSEQLNRELVRYADVIGATCIGSASNEELTDVDFDLAIIDEAGQVNMPSLLVPLVRASRAVLVGDHVQLPPYCDQALKNWARSQHEQLTALATKSAFELLFPHMPAAGKHMLKQQGRMPAVVRKFISAQFYDGELTDHVRRPLRDDLFAAAMAFIDTGELANGERRERRPRRNEPWPAKSFVNDAEAEIIADLAAYYHARDDDWVVIVPFSAQQGRVIDLLSRRLGNEELTASRVSSVDSFQGGERDTVIFGFTRSNASGEIGFLSDVRRSNVAFSRAKYRLIIVGDFKTLRGAKNRGFADMAEALYQHVRTEGDLRGYREMRARLAAEAGR